MAKTAFEMGFEAGMEKSAYRVTPRGAVIGRIRKTPSTPNPAAMASQYARQREAKLKASQQPRTRMTAGGGIVGRNPRTPSQAPSAAQRPSPKMTGRPQVSPTPPTAPKPQPTPTPFNAAAATRVSAGGTGGRYENAARGYQGRSVGSRPMINMASRMPTSSSTGMSAKAPSVSGIESAAKANAGSGMGLKNPAAMGRRGRLS